MFMQNPFKQDFRGNWSLGDRQYTQEFVVPGNKMRGDDVVVATGAGPFNLSGYDTDGSTKSAYLTIWYAFRNTTLRLNSSNNVVPSDTNSGFDRWASLTVDVSASASVNTGVSHLDIINALNSTAWTSNTAYVVGQLVVPTYSTGYYYKCTVAGTSGTTQPTWPTTSNATVTDGAGFLYQGSTVSGSTNAGSPTYGQGGGPVSNFGPGINAPQVGPVRGTALTWQCMGNTNTYAPPLTSFSSYFTASGQSATGNTMTIIRAKLPSTDFKFYIQNGGAEEKMLFNANAGVAELPTYFVRHQVTNEFNGTYPVTIYGTYANTASPLWCTLVSDTLAFGSQALARTNFPDGQNALVTLNPYNSTINPGGKNVDQGVVQRATNVPNNAVLDATKPNPDWKLLRGKSGLFTFQKLFLDGSSNIVEIIEYPAGAQAGDLGRITRYYRNGATNPYQITEEPYILQSGDLVQPTNDAPSGAWGSI